MRRRTTHLLALIALLIAFAGVGDAARADTTPRLFASEDQLLRGGHATQLSGSGFSPDVEYTVSADYGTLNGSAGSLPVTTSDIGTFTATFTMTNDVPADVTAVSIKVTDGSDTTVAAATVQVAAPLLIGGACPGQPIGDISAQSVDGGYPIGVIGAGFADGTYTLSSDSVTFAQSSVASDHGALTVQGHAVQNLAATFTVTATLQDAPSTSWTWTWDRGIARATADDDDTPWTSRIAGNCFAPGETVKLAAQDRYTSVPASVTAGAHGRVAATATIHPARQPVTFAGVKLTGTTSGQIAHTGQYPVPGTTLLAGEALTAGQSLISPKNGYMLVEGHECDPIIWHFSNDGAMHETWEIPARVPDRIDERCRLIMRTSGNLVLRSGAGKVLWATHTAGTRPGHYLRLRSDGVAAVYTARGKLIWSTRSGRTT